MTANQKLELQKGDIINARIDGMICRAREDGERKIVLTLLESMDIEEVSRVTKMSVEKIEDLRDFE